MDTSENLPVMIVTGLSGAGKSTVLNVFEDLRFFTIDGLPVGVVADLVEHLARDAMGRYRGVVLGMDIRQFDFLDDFEGAMGRLATLGVDPKIIYLEASNAVLVRRFATTRRPHPLEGGEKGLEAAVEHERELLRPVRERADLVLDTTDFSIHDLRRVIQKKWSTLGGSLRSLRVNLITFGFKYGAPSDADMVFDLRFLPNPYFEPALKELSGQDQEVQDFVLGCEQGKMFFQRFLDFILFLLPQYEAEGRYRVTIAIGCTGGKHRSVSAAEALRDALKKSDYAVALEHRHINLG
ncbi:RNase adapter RapZ [Oleidesulfovibrio sp.]|uniref:RNase adapter RapZ n=1 Tax=Oleidesulfovibrio sp. TaxID=2909707 RepID=UPI003A895A73